MLNFAARQGGIVLRALLAAALALLPSMGAAETKKEAFPKVPAGTYEYEVRHDSLGKIGTYTNVVSYDGTDTVVDTEVDISAKVLFIRVAREKAERRQVWRDGRLVSYESVTWSGDDKTVTEGRAEGDQFVIESPKGRTVAPAKVFPINPWSMAITEAVALMGEKNGTLHPIKDVKREERVLELGDEMVNTRYFKLIGHRDEEIWYDNRGVALKFAARFKGDTITFILKNGYSPPPQAKAH